MEKLTIEVTEITAHRLEALASAVGKSVDELAQEGLDSLTSSSVSRRAIVKARRAAARITGESYSLADLGWVDGYPGQTIDELLSFEGTERAHSILFAIEQAIQTKVQATGSFRMTGVERMVLSVMALSREVNN